MAYNADIATALSMAPQLGTLSGSTTPTSTAGTVIWNRAYNEVRLCFRKARLADTGLTASSLAEGLAQQAEMFLTSGYVLLAKGSIGSDARATAMELIEQGKALCRQIVEQREELIGDGGAEEATRANIWVKSHQIDDADTDFDFTPGTGDRQYAVNNVWPEDGDAL